MLLFDFKCLNLKCSRLEQIFEHWAATNQELPDCLECNQQMVKVLGYKLGSVKGGTPKFHK